MAGLFKRGRTWWISYRANGKLVRKSLGTENRKLARDKKSEIEYLIATKRLGLPSKTPVDELLADYFRHMRAHRKHKSAETDMGRFTRFFREVRVRYLEELKPGMVQKHLDERVLAGEIAQNTASKYRVCLHSLFEFAIRYKGFVSGDPQFPNPIKRVRRFKVSQGEIRFLTMPQIHEELQALRPWPKLRAMAATYIYAGLRRAEATWLTVHDVKLSARPPVLHIRAKDIDGASWEPKTKVPRVVPVSRALHAILSEYQLSAWREGPWFFPSPKGARWDEDNFSHDFRAAQKGARLRWNCLDFRHTFGSQLAQKGESLYKISKLMGNSPEICRKHYAALVPEQMAESVEFGEGGLGRTQPSLLSNSEGRARGGSA